MKGDFASNLTARVLRPFVKYHALSFLHASRVDLKQERLLVKKFRRMSRSRIGRELGVTPQSSIEQLPLTSYGFYRDYFANPQEGDLMYPLSDYVRVFTSGSMGKPKTFLLPKSGVWDNLSKTGLSFMFLSSHDGEKITYEVGDTVYRNIPGGSYLSGFLTDIFEDRRSGWVKQVPDINMSYHDKVEYFLKNYREIDVAYMTVTTLIDEIYPQIGEPFYLKGFVTQDRSAAVLKDKIKEMTGNHPKVTYGSTETFFSALPSIEHPGCFFFDWRILYCEFLPEGSALDPDQDKVEEPPETVPLQDVEAGRRYQLIATPFKNDMTRYIMPDILECVSKGDNVLGMELPVFSFFGRADRLVVLHNFTRIAEEELFQVLRDTNVPYVDFTARVEREGTKEYMALYLELSSQMEAEEVSALLHQELLKVDKDWRDLSDFMKYTPLKIRLLSKGTFKRYLREKEGMPRIERIGMREDRLTELLEIAGSLSDSAS